MGGLSYTTTSLLMILSDSEAARLSGGVGPAAGPEVALEARYWRLEVER